MCRVGGSNPRKQFALVVLVLVSTLGYRQRTYAQTVPAPPAPVPTIVTNADEVSLDLVVRDKRNKPVLDLKPEDVAITDNGALVKISDLHLVTGQSTTEHLVTMVFDRLEPSAANNARNIAGRILKALPDIGFSVSVLSVDGRLKLFQQFTADRAALGIAIRLASEENKVTAGNDLPLPEKNLIGAAHSGADGSGSSVNAKDLARAQIMLATLQESQRIVQDQHGQPALSGLLALARTQRRFAGRKVVIFFAQGMNLDSNANDMLRSIIGAANQAGISIYVIDANAVSPQASEELIATAALGNVMGAHLYTPAPLNSPTPPAFGSRAIAPGMNTQVSDQYSRFEADTLTGSKDPLSNLAVSTGGAHVSAGDNLRKPLQRMIEDMTTYYEASYVPSVQDYDGQFHPVAVKPLRAGLKIQSRAGYFALPPDGGSGMRPFEVPLMKILSEPELPFDLKFRSAVIRLGDLPDGNANALVVEVPLTELKIKEDANTDLYSLHASIVAQIKNKGGAVIEHFSEDIPRHGALETVEAARAGVVTLQRHFIAPPGEYTLEVAALDQTSGMISAQRSNFEIPRFPDGPSLSDLAVVRRTDPFKTETDPLEPLRYDNARIVPDLSGNISNKAGGISLFFMIHPDARAPEQARLEMEVLRNGDPIAHMPLPLRKTTGPGAIPYLASIQAGSLPAGHYAVTATLTQGEKTGASTASFIVGGAELANAAMPTRAGSVAGSPNDDIEMVSDAKLQTLGGDPHKTGRLTITSLTTPIAAPPLDQFRSILADARARALSYSISLPNFTCVETTDRAVDPSSTGKWKHKDTFAELVRYRDKSESRVMLQVNGRHSSAQRSDLDGPISQGEFGAVLNAVFQPSSKADFQYKETDELGAGTVLVLSYRVAQPDSTFSLAVGNDQMNVGFHGLVYVDSATRSVRRITLNADDVPNFSLHSTSIAVDYDYIAIATHDYLVPVRASVSLTQGKRRAVLNEIEFRDYRRYASQARVVYSDQVLH
jgi:VWFA-related protein